MRLPETARGNAICSAAVHLQEDENLVLPPPEQLLSGAADGVCLLDSS